MPTWRSYETQPDGRLKFIDDQGGELMLVSSPSVDAARAEIDARNAPPAPPAPPPAPAPLQLQRPAAMPDPILAVNGPQQTMKLASDASDPNAQGASGNAAPPAPEPAGAGGAPQAPPPTAQGQGGASGAEQPQGQGQPGSPIVRGGGGGPEGPTANETAAKLWLQDADRKLRGSPGVFVPGGTFPTGRTVQYAPGPDPRDTLAREAAERKLSAAQSDLFHVEARKQQELGEAALVEQQRAEERQRQMAELQAREQAKLDEVLGQIDTQRKELADARLEPDRLIRTMSTGREMILAAGLALGAFGKALSGDEGRPMAFDVLDQALKTDIEEQRFAIEQKRGNLNTLGEIYKLTRERFGSEKMAQEAAYLAGTEIYKAKVLRMTAEADAALGTDTEFDAEGRIIPGSPYSIRAAEALARLEVEQARAREALSQQMNGQVAQQFVTTQDKTVGAVAPDVKGAAESTEKAGKLLGEGGDQQQVFSNGQRYSVGKFVSPSEGAEVRKKLNLIGTLKEQIQGAKALRNSLVGVDPLKNKEYVDRVNSIAGMRSVLIDQGVLQGNEREEFQDLSKSILSGADVLDNVDKLATRIGTGYMDQLGAKPLASGSRVAIPQGVRDAADGKRPAGGGAAGAPRAASGGAPGAAPSAPVVRASGVRATPLDRTGAAVIQATTAKGDKAKAAGVDLAKKSLREALTAGQLGPSEYKVAVEMAQAGQFEDLLDFLGRMRGAVSLADASPSAPPSPQRAEQNAQQLAQQLQRTGLSDYTTRASAERRLGVGTTVTTKITKKGR